MATEPFDLNTYRRTRIRQLEQHCAYLEGERDRLENLLAALLLMASRTIHRDPMLILEACCTVTGTNPAHAHIHQPAPAPDHRHDAVA